MGVIPSVEPASEALNGSFDDFLAAAIAGSTNRVGTSRDQTLPDGWPLAWNAPDVTQAFVARALYHGIAGVLINRSNAMEGWPAPVVGCLGQQALGQGMWELRHKLVVVGLIEALAKAGVPALLLKGTALAYDLYADPAERCRGDTDVLVAPAQITQSRDVLEARGFVRESAGEGLFGDLHAQEIWRHVSDDGFEHVIDLHWQLLNSPFLDPLMPYNECAAGPVPIPRLCASARAMPRVMMLLHACLHRAVHISNPYYVDGQAYLGGGRLIWLLDIKLMADACSDREWAELSRLAVAKGLSALCLEALESARAKLGAKLPASVREALSRAPANHEIGTYLTTSSQFGRAWRDFKSTPGVLKKLRFGLSQTLPSPDMVRDKYPSMRDRPIMLLYGRRLAEILGRRVSGSSR
ncbi:nucleotidyltransferase family protein [Novosphingobium sp.]|uniref:nucleotidyltransferase family protein n=1 Tax=Novosphingobium sp. TaxID=1874826 RepID=UPI0025E0AC45|nr:nucleotidyltransferase family protein [Novosphingobium sp.]